jgi:hypothetical protein
VTHDEARRHLRNIDRLRKRSKRMLWWARVCAAIYAQRTWQAGC